jgi:hypothetical protein
MATWVSGLSDRQPNGIYADRPLNEIAELLERHHIKRVPVLKDGKLAGSPDDWLTVGVLGVHLVSLGANPCRGRCWYCAWSSLRQRWPSSTMEGARQCGAQFFGDFDDNILCLFRASLERSSLGSENRGMTQASP